MKEPNSFTLDDFLDQMDQMKNLGSMEDIMKMIPGMDAKALGGAQIDEKQMARTKAIIQSMTKAERKDPGHPHREPQEAHCAWQRHQRAGSQPPDEPV